MLLLICELICYLTTSVCVQQCRLLGYRQMMEMLMKDRYVKIAIFPNAGKRVYLSRWMQGNS